LFLLQVYAAATSDPKLYHVFGPTVSGVFVVDGVDLSKPMVVHGEDNLKFVQSSKTNSVANTTIQNNPDDGVLVTVSIDEEWVA